MNVHRPVLVTLLSLCAASCGTPPETGERAEPTRAALDLDSVAVVFAERAADGFAGAVVIRSAGQQVFGAAAGDAVEDTPFTEGTAIDIASISKPVTAMAILKLAEQGRLGLDDSIERWFPQAPEDKRPITLRQLLSHTSGVADFVAGVNDYTPITADGMARRLLEAPLVFAPGEQSSYSNGGFNLLGIIVERASGMPLFEYLEDHVFRPAGVTAHYDPERFPAARVAGAWRNGRWMDVRALAAARNGPFWGLWGAGGLFVSAADLALLTETFMQGGIVGEGLVSEALSPVVAEGRGSAHAGLGWGLIDMSVDSPVRLLVYHNGGSRHSSTDLRYYPEVGVTIASVSNQGPGSGTGTGRLISRAALHIPPPRD